MRNLRFVLLEAIVLPLGVWLFRVLMWTWRVYPVSPALLADLAGEARLIFTMYHGRLVESVAYTGMWRAVGRRWVVLTTPSLDGRLAAAMLARFGVAHAALRSGERGIEAAREYTARVAAGEVGLLLVDGPRGPRDVVKAGVPRTVGAAGARVVVAAFASSPCLRLGSWDRTVLPLPFARVLLHCAPVPLPEDGRSYDLATLQAAMDAAQVAAARVLETHSGAQLPPAGDAARPVHRWLGR